MSRMGRHQLLSDMSSVFLSIVEHPREKNYKTHFRLQLQTDRSVRLPPHVKSTTPAWLLSVSCSTWAANKMHPRENICEFHKVWNIVIVSRFLRKTCTCLVKCNKAHHFNFSIDSPFQLSHAFLKTCGTTRTRSECDFLSPSRAAPSFSCQIFVRIPNLLLFDSDLLHPSSRHLLYPVWHILQTYVPAHRQEVRIRSRADAAFFDTLAQYVFQM